MIIESFAQYQDDIIIRSFFNCLDIKHPSYLDIGANHPIELSNTYHFYKDGSRGVLVEPNESLIEEIKEIRPEDIVLNVGVAGQVIKDKAVFSISTEQHVLNTFVPNNMEFHGVRPTGKKEIDLININSILEKYFKKGCDFISIDVEGMELDILSTLDFDRFRAKLFIIEVPIDNQQKIDLYRLMFNNDYYILYDPLSYGNVIFIDRVMKKGHFESIFGGDFANVAWQQNPEKTNLESENIQLNAQIQQLASEKTNLKSENIQLDAQIQQLASEKELIENRLAVLQNELDTKNITLNIANQQICDLQTDLGALYKSTSWKVTKPLRIIKELLMRFVALFE